MIDGGSGALFSMVLHASIAWIGTTVFCVVVQQPAWVPLLAAAIAACPSLYRLFKDHRLKNAQAANEALARENAELRRLLELDLER